MSFRDDEEALRNRVSSLEDALRRSEEEARTLREERDRARAAPPAPPAPVPTRPFPVGAKVWVEWGRRWWRATVVHEAGPGLWRIHYDGWSAKWDETVGPSRIATGDHAPPGRRASGSAFPVIVVVLLILAGVVAAALRDQPSRYAEPPGRALATTFEVHPGDAIWVESEGVWYDAAVLNVTQNAVRIHYTGYDAHWDEDVPITRVRRP